MKFEPEKTPIILIVLLLPFAAVGAAILVTLFALAGFARLLILGEMRGREGALSSPREFWRRLHESIDVLRGRRPPRVPLFERALALAGAGALESQSRGSPGLREGNDDRAIADIQALTQFGLLRLISDALDDEYAERAAADRSRRATGGCNSRQAAVG